jgi:hypothetical protein
MKPSGLELSSLVRKSVLTVHVIASVGLIGSSAGTVGVAQIAAGTQPAGDVGAAQWRMPAAAALNIVFAAASATLAIFKPGGRVAPSWPLPGRARRTAGAP